MGSKKLERLMERDIPERDIGILRSLVNLADDYGTGDAQDLPYELREAYWKYKLVHDRIDSGAVPMEGFKIMALLCGLGKPIEGDAEEETILELSDAGKIAVGDPVLFKFGRKEVQGFFQGITRDRRTVRVVAVGDSEVRGVPIGDCIPDPSREPQDLTPASAKKVDEDAKAEKRKPGRPKKETVAAAAGERPDIHAGQSQDDDDI